MANKKSFKTKFSTSATALESLRNFHPVIDLILKYRKLTKLNSTYCAGLLKAVSKKDGRVHSNFNQTETKTGRLSSNNPNLQNIPIRTKLGKKIREFFVPKSGCVLIDADYSQIELRVLAHLSKDETMINAFKNSEDIHTAVACEIFNLPKKLITNSMRNSAKVVNFGIIYGMSAFTLAKDIGITKKEAEDYINAYFKRYSKIKEFLDLTIKNAKNTGYIKTLYGRMLRVPDINSKKVNIKLASERIARNMPIQGTAADIIKIAMINVHNRLKKENLKSKLILQIHDELILESPIEESTIAKDILRFEMEHAANLLVPLIVNVGIGKNWNEASK